MTTSLFINGGIVLPSFMILKNDLGSGQNFIEIYTGTRKVVS
jgi:hypothetical protein